MRSAMRRVHVDLDEHIKKVAHEMNLSYTAASKLVEIKIMEEIYGKNDKKKLSFKL